MKYTKKYLARLFARSNMKIGIEPKIIGYKLKLMVDWGGDTK